MGQLIEATRIDDLDVTVGFLHIPGAGFRVSATGQEHTRHMSIAACRRLATDLDREPELREMVILLRTKADRLEGWLEGRREDHQLTEAPWATGETAH